MESGGQVKQTGNTNDTTFDKDKFMEAQWARLAAWHGVSVEEVKSKEFDELLEKEVEEIRNREARIDKVKNAEIWREIRNGGIFAGIAAALGWFTLSTHRWWFPIPSIIVAILFMSLEKESVDQVKRKDFIDNTVEYWERVQSSLAHCQTYSAVITFAVVLFLVLALAD